MTNPRAESSAPAAAAATLMLSASMLSALTLAALALLALALPASGAAWALPAQDGGGVARVEVRPAEVSAAGGAAVRFEAVALDASGQEVRGLPITWFADSYQQVSIDSTGLAVGRELGTVRIGAAVGGKVGTGLLTVTELPVAKLTPSLPGSANRLLTGQSARLEVLATTALGAEAPAGAGTLQGLELEFSSSDPAVVEVSGLGRATARRPGRAVVTVRDVRGPARGELPLRVEPNPVASVTLEAPSGRTRTGDVLRLRLQARDAEGRALEGVPAALGVTSPGASAWLEPDGPRFVAEEPGIYTVVASVGGVSAQTDVAVRERGTSLELALVGRAPVRHTASTDFALFEGLDGRDYMIQGTIPGSPRLGFPTEIGDRYYVWDVTEPSRPALTDSILVNARRASDPRVEPGGRWAVLTHEGDPERKNGVTFVDLSTPAHPRVLGRFTERLEGGVHNVWIDGHHVFAVSNGPNSLVILDAKDPARPRVAGEFGLPEPWRRVFHDVWVEDGLAYLSYWLDGLVVLDIGNGMAGGSVEKPVQVSQILYDMEPLYGPGLIAGTHTAWREGDYVFVGDEVFPWQFRDQALPPSPRGRIHVVDVSDLDDPRIVAFFEVPEAGSHCVWVEDGKLYVANYQAGLRVVDVTGELRGDLYRQGRELARFDTSAPIGEGAMPFKADAWGIQLFKGRVYVADSNSGAWIFDLREKPAPTYEPLLPPS